MNELSSDEKRNMIVVCGPTACKKTGTGVLLAQRLGGEIISADSMQIYKCLDIGTAKPDIGEMGGIAHHLIDVVDPCERFSAVDFKHLAVAAAEKISIRGHIPIVVGGTGFYINALLKNTEFAPMEPDYTYREELARLAAERGAPFLYAMLKKIDPKSCETIHENNIKRVIRALEYYKITNNTISSHNSLEKTRENYYNAAIVKLYCDRERMYQNIDRRVDKMVAAGLFEEVERVMKRGCTRDMISMQGIGYKEVIACLLGETTRDEAVTSIKTNTRHFAKRQLTWFSRQIGGEWFDIYDPRFPDIVCEYIASIF